MRCIKCGFNNPDDAKFCQKCANTLALSGQFNQYEQPAVNDIKSQTTNESDQKNDYAVQPKSKKKKIFKIFMWIIIVVGLIFIASLVLPLIFFSNSLNNAQIKSRDARRVSDIKSIQTALDFYYNDAGSYPGNITPGSKLSHNENVYMSVIPKNPTPNDGKCPKDFEYKYEVKNDGQSYRLTYCLGLGAGGFNAGINSIVLDNNDKTSNQNNITNENKIGPEKAAIDSDNDELSDEDERNTWHTNPNNPDTDDDGYKDGDEVKNEYDPLVAGNTRLNETKTEEILVKNCSTNTECFYGSLITCEKAIFIDQEQITSNAQKTDYAKINILGEKDSNGSCKIKIEYLAERYKDWEDKYCAVSDKDAKKMINNNPSLIHYYCFPIDFSF